MQFTFHSSLTTLQINHLNRLGTRVTVEYNAIDFKTLPEKRQYRTRITSYELRITNQSETRIPYNPPTKETSFDWIPKKPGTYIFEVQAIDRDLNYSEPAWVELEVIEDPRNHQIAQLESELERRNRELEAELQDAHDMQMSLMPETAPLLEGVEIAGKCVPANTVGGDFFDYLSLADGRIGIALADVSGKGLKGAMNAVMANGMLHEIAKMQASCGKILSVLNASLYPRMEKMMFTALGLAILDQDAKTLQWANAAQPFPLVKRGEQVFEFKSDGELPLGMIPKVAYPDSEFPLQAGDIVVFYTDGVIEAENESEEIYGSERLEQVVSRINPAMTADEIIETILADVADFVESAERYDDMTVVVAKVL